MNVALLVTGNVEWHGLGTALEALFPGHTFQMYPSAEEVRSNNGAVPAHGFTSFELKESQIECPCWIARDRPRKQRPKWLGATDRRRHPKGYLQWLCRDGAEKTCTRYSEAADGAGVALLKGFDWRRALTGHASAALRMRYLAAMVDDLSDALGPPSVGAVPDGLPHPLTSRRTPRREPTLRNL